MRLYVLAPLTAIKWSRHHRLTSMAADDGLVLQEFDCQLGVNDLLCMAGHTAEEPLWSFVHKGFFGPTREQSYLDNWDGELDDVIALLQEQVGAKTK